MAAGLIDSDTIVAISTPPGRGGIGVVRVSGNLAKTLVEGMVPLATEFQPRHSHYGILRDDSGAAIDDALVVFFPGPHSYTGEDVVEISVHGSPVVLEWVVRQAVQRGARPARAGEFTERAFLSGRMDLTQAEAVRDLIDAQTLEGARVASSQLGGALAAQVRPWKQALVELIAALEAGIDFAEDDIDLMPAEEIERRFGALESPLEQLLASFAYGRLLREGLRLAIAGRPNAGKSSLFNRLVERDRAIVTPMAGTTRDVVSERVSLEGIPLELLDTAGLRETDDMAERMGVERTREALAEADAVLLVTDAAAGPDLHPGDQEVLASLTGRPVILVRNKADLVGDAERVRDAVRACPPRQGADAERGSDVREVWTSATTGEGIAELRAAVRQIATGSSSASGANAILTNLRQRDAIAGALAAVARARAAAVQGVPHEMLLLDAYDALRALDDLTGATTAEEILALIFSTFCIGK